MNKQRWLKVGIAAAVCVTILSGLMIAFSDAGDSNDPLVTKSYIVEKVIPDMKAYVDEAVAKGDGGQNQAFTVVNVLKGTTVLGEAGTEMILRMGSGTVVATQKGGLADTTAGYDLPSGTAMPSNHMLIVPLGDGRGFTATSDSIVMIKGGYSIQ